MAAKPKTSRTKAPALIIVPPQTREECAADIKALGDLQRQLAREQATMNDAIAEITQSHQPRIDELKGLIEKKMVGIQTWAEANRAALTNDNKVKTANLTTGSIQWRIKPPSISIRGVESVLETLKRLGLTRFIRVKEEPNKEAMLNEPEVVKGIAGISIISGVEDFVVTPFEQEVA